ncbi:hypothetical protein [Rhodococcus phage REQ1]|uniref:hypothetical protein n=1 Tax=Rhodococcus phage REQ1 TaxID=1109712 RepID=UPI00023EEC4F|nr:hypothetical protein RoPhREQ1_gp45 [Rhodococcus phage REQ1]AEV52041.1 hypothetical protein [Rhodococcus phage REQ1]
MATPAHALRKAIELLKEDGWIQGAMHTPGGYCSIGAIRQGALHALGEDDVERNHQEFKDELSLLREETDRLVRGVIRDRYNHSSIVHWNDDGRRMVSEVLDVFETALQQADR